MKSGGNGACAATPADGNDCPAGETCNPPPPAPYPCPKDVDTFPVTVVQAADTKKCTTTAIQYHHVDCPAGTHCNPPPPSETTFEVPCPK